MNRRHALKLITAGTASAAFSPRSFAAVVPEVIRAASFDGNDHDQDDIGASPVMMALAQGDPEFVHLHFNSHFPSSIGWQAAAMRTSVYGARDRFGFAGSIYDHSPGNLAVLINGLSATRTMRYYLGGPAETLWRGLSASTKAKHQYVTVVSHSGWNNDHRHNGTHNLADCRRVFPTFKVKPIADQNAKLRTAYSQWFWARDSQYESMRFLYARIVASKKQLADVSDAGMYFHDAYGYSPSVYDIRLKIDPELQ